MKRMIGGLALTLAVVATPAQATAPKDPVAAVKHQYVPGRGVTFSERTSVLSHGKRSTLMQRKGTLQFGRSGVTAWDATGNMRWPEQHDDQSRAMASPEHVLTVGGKSWVSGSLWSARIPEDKKWMRAEHDAPHGLMIGMGHPVDVTEAATLKTLLAHASRHGSSYAGKITFGQLKRVSPAFRASHEPTSKQSRIVISWKLAVNARGLPTRLVTTYSAYAVGGGDGDKKSLFQTDVRYTGWGAKVKLRAPRASEVVE